MKDRQNRVIYVLSQFLNFSLELGFFYYLNYFLKRISKLIFFAWRFSMLHVDLFFLISCLIDFLTLYFFKLLSVSLSYFCRFNMSIGLVWANGEHWKKVRRFALHSMRDLGVGKKSIEEVIQDEAKTLTNIFASKENQPITDVKRMMTTSISNVIHHVVFGFRYVCKVKQLKWKSINLQYLQFTCIWGSE